jgi:hypothetical protein
MSVCHLLQLVVQAAWFQMVCCVSVYYCLAAAVVLQLVLLWLNLNLSRV